MPCREGIQQHQLQRFQAAIEQLQIAPGGTVAHALPSPTAAEQPTNSPVQASLPHAEPQKLQTLAAMKVCRLLHEAYSRLNRTALCMVADIWEGNTL